MENRRLILLALIGVVCYVIYQTWQTDYRRPEGLVPVAAGPSVPVESRELATASASVFVEVETGTVSGRINLAGGELRRLELDHYRARTTNPDSRLPLLDDRDGHWSVLQSGLAGPQRSYTDNTTAFQAGQSRYQLAADSDTLQVPLHYTDPSGFSVTKTFTFHRDSYLIDLAQTLDNQGTTPLSASAYARWIRAPVSYVEEPPFMHPFMGFGLYEKKPSDSDFRFRKYAFKDLVKSPYDNRQTGGWLAVLEHYFVSALIPPPDEAATLTLRPASAAGEYVGQYVGAAHDLAPGSTQAFAAKLYVGPRAHDLDAIAPGLDLTEDYGIWKPIAVPLFWVLNQFHKLAHNWGAAIILLTVFVKALFYKLSEAQYRSMAKTRKFAPRLQELRERFADNREALNKAMMDLYKKEGFNPLAGCWPILVQFPVFLSLYSMVSGSVELRESTFLWIQDLTAPDPIYVLPVLYGAAMWLQQRMSGQSVTMDPAQARIMGVMPIAMTGMFAFFPAGLVLYWFVNTAIGIAQQWLINFRLEKEGLGRKSSA